MTQLYTVGEWIAKRQTRDVMTQRIGLEPLHTTEIGAKD